MCMCRFFDRFVTVDRCCLVFPLKIGCYIIAIITIFELFCPFNLYVYDFNLSKSSIGQYIFNGVVVLTMVTCVFLGICAFILIMGLLQDGTQLLCPWLHAIFYYIIVKALIFTPCKFYVSPQSVTLYANTIANCLGVALYFYFFLVVNSYRMTRPRPQPKMRQPKAPKPPKVVKVRPPPKAPAKPKKDKPGKKGATVENVDEKAKAVPAGSAVPAQEASLVSEPSAPTSDLSSALPSETPSAATEPKV